MEAPVFDQPWCELTLASGQIALVDQDDFESVSKFKWRLHSGGYAYASVYGKKVLLHRFVKPGFPRLDHWNRNRLDCRKNNLRPATGLQNAGNRISRIARPEKLKGVRFKDRGYEAYIKRNGRYFSLGRFSSERLAAQKYNEAAIQHFGIDFALLNPLPETKGRPVV